MCYQMRCDPVNLKMKALVDAGAVGKIAVIRRRHAIPLLLNPAWATPGNWHIDPVQNLGMFMDDASHAADWFYWMLGKPVSVMAEIDNVVTDAAPDDNGVALYRFSRGEIGILFNSSDAARGRSHEPRFTAMPARFIRITAMRRRRCCRPTERRSSSFALARRIGSASTSRSCRSARASAPSLDP